QTRLTDPDLWTYPYLYMTGHGNVRFTEEEVRLLRRYLMNGGFLHADDNYGMDESFRREIRRVFPEYELTEIPADHPVFHSFYDFPRGMPKIHLHDGKPAQAFGIFHDGRLVVFYSYETDLGNGWEDADRYNDPPEVRELAFRMGVNLFVYALAQVVSCHRHPIFEPLSSPHVAASAPQSSSRSWRRSQRRFPQRCSSRGCWVPGPAGGRRALRRWCWSSSRPSPPLASRITPSAAGCGPWTRPAWPPTPSPDSGSHGVSCARCSSSSMRRRPDRPKRWFIAPVRASCPSSWGGARASSKVRWASVRAGVAHSHSHRSVRSCCSWAS